MNASIKIGIMALMVLSMFNGVALADPIVGGGDAGNTYGAASALESEIPHGTWGLYQNGYVQTSDVDWYNLNTYAGETLSYELDRADWPYDLLDIYTSATTTIGNDNVGSVYVYGNTKQRTMLSPGGGAVSDYYMFRLKIN
ncbi:MAG: hypothetical protein WA144_02490 [Candidatus Methanoperedens sp.]